jgi:hypothetical protein
MLWPVDHESRIAKNEGVFREINERIEVGQSPAPTDQLVAFLCECGRLRCSDLVEMTLPEYEAVRAHPRRFLLVAGHQMPDVEKIVTERSGYIVVEKFGEAGRVAEDDDPRGA